MTERPIVVRFPTPVTAVRAAPGDEAGAAAPAGLAGQPSAGDGQGLQDAQQRLEAERAALAQTRTALADGLAKLKQLREQVISQAEEQLVELALEIARKVLMQEIQAGRCEIDPIVREALVHVPARQDVVVHLNPEDLTRCQMAREAEASPDSGSVRFVADPSVRPAECRLEAPEGIVESTMETHLGEIAEALKDRE